MMTRTLLLILAACGHAEPPVAPTPTPAPERRTLTRATVPETTDGPLDVHVRVRAKHDRVTLDVGPDDVLHTNDYVELLLSVNAKAYVYVVQVFPDGSTDVLFPDKDDVRVAPGAIMRVPAASTDWFQLDDLVGVETLYVVASHEPIAKVDQALGKEIAQMRAIAAPAATPTPTPTPTPATPMPPTPLSKSKSASHARPERMLSMASRSLHRVSKVDGAPEVAASAGKDDGFVVARFSFRHAH